MQKTICNAITFHVVDLGQLFHGNYYSETICVSMYVHYYVLSSFFKDVASDMKITLWLKSHNNATYNLLS